MRDTVRYINAQGEEQLFSRNGCLCNTKALREFLYTVQNKRLYNNQPKTIVVEIVFHGTPEERDHIIDILEYDTVNNTYGRLYVNDWYILCRFVGIQTISKEGWNNIRIDLQFTADTIEWNKDSTAEVNVPTEISETDADYPIDYPFDYAEASNPIFFNNELSPADFILETELTADMISANAVSYTITDGAGGTHTYTVSLTGYTVSTGDKFVLNTREKTVVVIHNGTPVSVFGGASDSSYIFEPLKAGINTITSSYESDIVFTLITHRRTPKWKT